MLCLGFVRKKTRFFPTPLEAPTSQGFDLPPRRGKNAGDWGLDLGAGGGSSLRDRGPEM